MNQGVRHFGVWAFLVVTALATGAVLRAQPAQLQAPKTTEQQFKNIQVLQGVPADQLIPAMQFITASLGVKCDFCHVQDAFEKDEKKPKQTARKMMEMMFAINKVNFDGQREVTCYSCHRGSTAPVSTPLVGIEETGSQAEGEPKANADDTSLPPADQIIARYIAALGGAAAIDKINTRVQKGNLTMPGGRQLPIEIFSRAPDERVSAMHLPNGDSITAFISTAGWLAAPGRPVRDMGKAELDAARLDADLHFATDLHQLFREFKSAKKEKIGDHEAIEVLASNPNSPAVRLYFDKQTSLLARMVRYADSPLGLNPTQIDYADYRDSGGVKTPFRWTLSRPGNQFTIQVDQTDVNVPIDAGKFVKPASPEKKP
jgi:hypothetical protein